MEPSTPNWLTPFVPFIQTFFTLAVTAFLSFISKVVWDKWRIDLDGKNREAFQTAATNAGALVSAGGTVGDAVTYVLDHVPDAVAHFKLGPRKIEETIMAKVAQAPAPEAAAKAIVKKSPAVETRPKSPRRR